MTWLHRHRRAFVLVNGLLIVGFALGALAIPEQHWGLLGVQVEGGALERVMAWYLLVLGVGALLAARRPEGHPVVLTLVGLEKLGPALAFPALFFRGQANALLAGIGAFDGSMAIVLLVYVAWLRKAGAVDEEAPD